MNKLHSRETENEKERRGRWRGQDGETSVQKTQSILFITPFIFLCFPRSLSDPPAFLFLGIAFWRDRRDGERQEETDNIVISSVSSRLSPSRLSLPKGIPREKNMGGEKLEQTLGTHLGRDYLGSHAHGGLRTHLGNTPWAGLPG